MWAFFDLAEVLLDSGHRVVFDVVEVHHLILDVKVEFSSQEASQVLMDEVVERVPGGVLREMFLNHRAIGVGFGWGELPEFSLPLLGPGMSRQL